MEHAGEKYEKHVLFSAFIDLSVLCRIICVFLVNFLLTFQTENVFKNIEYFKNLNIKEIGTVISKNSYT